jgi:hypothetical protein
MTTKTKASNKPANVSKPAAATTTTNAPRLAPDDFYEVTARAEGGAVRLAVFNRRKDEALRIIEAAHKAGSDMGAAISKAYAVAFPRRPASQTRN